MKSCRGSGTIDLGACRYNAMYSIQFSSESPLSGTNQSLLIAVCTVGLLRSLSFARITSTTGFCMPPPWPASGIATRASEVTTFQKTWKRSKVFLRRFVPDSSCKTTTMEVCFLSISRSVTTSSTMPWSTAARWSSATCPRKASRTCGRPAWSLGGSTCSSAWRSSSGRAPASSRCRKTPTALRSSSTPRRSMSLSRGPMEPKTGSICRCAVA
mmetsp:Transcript_23455/g.73768  ORF Transcript_23455/g.73768 Transcript_23455/m.73768 type:complete len:213 (+) Transcript_23455:688-1326(+)